MTWEDSKADFQAGRITHEELHYWNVFYHQHSSRLAAMPVFRQKRRQAQRGHPYDKRLKTLRANLSFRRTTMPPATLAARIRSNTPETKYFDTGINVALTSGVSDWTGTEVPCDNTVNSSGVAAAYTDSCLIPTAIGSGYGQVNGNRYKLKKLRVRGSLRGNVLPNLADPSPGLRVRLMLVLDTQPNGLQAQGEDVMQDIGANETLYSFKRIADSSGRFRIVKDEFYQMNPAVTIPDGTNTGSQSFNNEQFSFQYTPKEPQQINIKSGNATATIAGTITHNYFLLLHTEGQEITITAAARAYYYD